ncbi:hypothetical protein [Methylocystis iwaonis]|uniref:Uncharacterized protein n=1 Tax=Methylocystis iwaonis TaxID=2885079 RepID=A0ABN6VH20_9HYPH|nr:hypothetical protein [Methylocystis iwaonis]BDV34055.1 hypothetical protein SS37A_15840 [Methylocystis iwaonis]
MSEVEILNSVRAKLVTERRRIARLVGEPQEDSPERWANTFKSVQEFIEAVDRAIADEVSIENAEAGPTAFMV